MAKTNSNIVTPFNMGLYGTTIVLNVTPFCHKLLKDWLRDWLISKRINGLYRIRCTAAKCFRAINSVVVFSLNVMHIRDQVLLLNKMDVNIYVLMLLTTLLPGIHCGYYISGTITDNVEFFYRTLPVPASVHATIEFNVSCPMSAERAFMGFRTVYLSIPFI